MTEVKWLECSDPHRMLSFLHISSWRRWLTWRSRPFHKTSKRKLRLFACACFRRQMVRHPVRSRDQSLEAVSVAERWVDGQATAKELETARQYCYVMPPGNVWSTAHVAFKRVKK
jgi:hypothetical protein